MPLTFSHHKQNKGSILRASVEYIKDLKKDKQKLHKMEEGKKLMDNKCQKLLFRIFVSLVKKAYKMLSKGKDMIIRGMQMLILS